MGNRFLFPFKLISASCLAVLHFSNISGFTINCGRFVTIDFRSKYMNRTIGFSRWHFIKYGSTMEHVKLSKAILSSAYFSLFGQTSTILSPTHLFSTNRLAQNYNVYIFDSFTTWKSSLRAGERCSRLNPPFKMSFMPQHVLSTPDLTVPAQSANYKCPYQ